MLADRICSLALDFRCGRSAHVIKYSDNESYWIRKKIGGRMNNLLNNSFRENLQDKKWKLVSFILIFGISTVLAACGNQANSISPEKTDSVQNSQNLESTSEDTGTESAINTSAAGEFTANEPVISETIKNNPIGTNELRHGTDTEGAVVYMTTDISPEGMMAVYEALEWTPSGKVAVKLSTGEPPASNYLDPELIKDVVQTVNGTIVENNTAYGGSRAETAMHYQVAQDHGFTTIADFQILDENGSMSLPVQGGVRLTENLVGAHFGDYDSYLVLSHFKGHAMAGLGGAIKNISIGLGSKEGKCLIHTAGASHTSPWGGEQDAFLESMAEAGKSVSDYLNNGENIVYINVMNRLSVDCDCDGNPAEPDMHDIGILASHDPVALDQACVDLVYAADDNNAALIQRMESRNGEHTLEHAEEIGLGSRTYHIISLDE